MAQKHAPDAGGDTSNTEGGTRHAGFYALVLGAIGVVYGDIGTSPLYAFREAVMAAQGQGLAQRDIVLGVLSLILWALVVVVTLKYVWLLLRASNNGEGGTFALMALGQRGDKRHASVLLLLGVAGAAFFFGDAMVTPAISVISAVEGLKLVHPEFSRFVVPVSIAIIIALFWVQSVGTERVAKLFGPVTVIWFITMAVGGLIHIADAPIVLAAVNPMYGLALATTNGLLGLTILGLVFLAVTGAEALYADLGHFGRKPIQFAWFALIFPALTINYLGQGALVIVDPHAVENSFFKLYPAWALIPVVLLATFATIIASQAVISGAFSVARQAIQLGVLPRLGITHTSASVSGQIYIASINWLLLAGVLLLVILFKTSGNLATAYGISVTATMIITTVMAFFVIWKHWQWRLWTAIAIFLPLLIIELVFFTANILKIVDGGWLPLLFACSLMVVMFTWVKGTRFLARHERKKSGDLAWLARRLDQKPPARVAGTAVFLTATPDAAPTSLMHNLKHNRVLHERNIILAILTEDAPRVANHDRVEIDKVSDSFIRVVGRYGFMETPNIPKLLESCRRKGLNIDMAATSFFLSRRTLKPTRGQGLPMHAYLPSSGAICCYLSADKELADDALDARRSVA